MKETIKQIETYERCIIKGEITEETINGTIEAMIQWKDTYDSLETHEGPLYGKFLAVFLCLEKAIKDSGQVDRFMEAAEMIT